MPPKSQDERAADIAQKSESMARELSQKREMRIRQERVRQLSTDDAPQPTKPPRTPSGNTNTRQKPTDDRTVRAEDMHRDTRVDPPPERPMSQRPVDPAFFPGGKRGTMLDDVAVELEELVRDMRAGWKRFAAADRITFLAAVTVLVGVFLPWTSDKVHKFSLGITSGGVIHAAFAIVAIALCVGRWRRSDGSGERLNSRDRMQRARRASIWHLLIGAASTALCAFFLVLYGLQRSAETGLEIRYGLYVTLAAGMGLSYGGFARFWSRHDADR
jgi:hypothetical protein